MKSRCEEWGKPCFKKEKKCKKVFIFGLRGKTAMASHTSIRDTVHKILHTSGWYWELRVFCKHKRGETWLHFPCQCSVCMLTGVSRRTILYHTVMLVTPAGQTRSNGGRKKKQSIPAPLACNIWAIHTCTLGLSRAERHCRRRREFHANINIPSATRNRTHSQVKARKS